MEGSILVEMMKKREGFLGRVAATFVIVTAVGLSAASICAESPVANPSTPGIGSPLVPNGGGTEGNLDASEAVAEVVASHPLIPALKIAQSGMDKIRETV